jgi:5-hydroxyisourate hydrolase-like protein (transthyretin family)
MRVNKIVPFSVAILLITVSFAGVAVVSAQSTQTQLTAVANVTTVAANTPFTINGTLNATGGTGISGATIQLQNSTDNATWNNVTPTTATDANGNYSFSNSESANGTYYYRTIFAGIAPTYVNATSAVVTVTVIKIPTQLTVAAPTSATAGTSFTINGTLNTTSGPIAGATITLQKNVSGTWNNVATNVTDANGNYSFSNSESANGAYQYQTTYAGNPTYANATSAVVIVTVGKIPTQLTVAANVTTVPVNEFFTIDGTLNATSNSINPISGATVTLQSSTDDATWTNVATNVTNATGGYQFSINESTSGTYYYRTTYAGNALENNATSPAVTVQVTQVTTQLSIAANVTAVETNQNFTISGTLNTTSGTSPGPGFSITLQKNVSGTWNNVATNVTNATGGYQFSINESTSGTYYYRTTFAGSGTILSPATSAVVTVQVVIPTTLTAVANVTAVETNQNFTINGTLNTTLGPIAGATITLQKNVSGNWMNVATNVTDTNGAYSFSTSEPVIGTYNYQTTYAGHALESNATSAVVTVLVNTTSTQLTAVANPNPTLTNQNFTISGTLSDTSGNPIPSATITLQNNSTGSWNSVMTTTTNATGGYQFSLNESVNGTYHYRTNFTGIGQISAATSNVVNMTVDKITTQLSAVASPTTVTVNAPFTINGTLNTTSGIGIANATVQLQWYSGGTWTNATGETNNTTSTGTYSISTSGPAVGTYQYKTIYAGSGTTYSNATSAVVTVQVVIPTTLTVVANVTTVAANTPFTINGTLSFTSGTGIAGATITLQKNVSGTWTNVATNVTDANGNYSFSNSESAGGAYYYRTTYAGDPFIGAATSPVVTVTVGAVLIPTQLTVAAPASATAGTSFTINGTLNTTSGTGIAGATIQLQKNVSGTWQTVTGKTNTTTSTGAYRISTSEPTASTYQYRTTYAGNATYKNATSNVVSVNITAPITPASSPAVTAQNANSLDLYVRGSDNALWHKYWTGTTWTAATSLGGNLTSAPAATSPANGAMAVFVRGTNGALYEKTTTDNGTSWSGWLSLGGQLASGTGPAADARGPNSLDVFVQGTDHVLYYTHGSGTTWSAWKSLGGVLTSSPAATSPSTSVIDVFVSSTNGALWSVNSTNGGTTWSGWLSLGGQLASGTGPAADARGPTSLDVFVQGTNGAVYEKTTTNNGATWSGWTSLGGVLAAGSSPAATSPGSGQVDISVLGTGNVLWWKTTTNSGASWSGWMSVGDI